MSFRYTASAESDATGNISIALPSPNAQQSWVATLNVPQSGAGVSWQVVINDIVVDTKQGSSGFGPIKLTSSESVELRSANATPNTTYQAVIQGVFSNAEVTPPGSLTAVATTLPMVPLTTIATAAGPVQVVVPIQPYYRSLILMGGVGLGATSVSVVGTVTGYEYATNNAITAQESSIVDLIGAAFDDAVTITVAGGGSGHSVFVMADQAIQNQLVFSSLGGLSSRLVRPDGRNYPIGEGLANITGAGVLIGAQGAGLHIMLASAYIACYNSTSSLGEVAIFVSLGGVGLHILSAFCASGVANIDQQWPAGILLDANTNVSVQTEGTVTNLEVGAVFDVVA